MLVSPPGTGAHFAFSGTESHMEGPGSGGSHSALPGLFVLSGRGGHSAFSSGSGTEAEETDFIRVDVDAVAGIMAAACIPGDRVIHDGQPADLRRFWRITIQINSAYHLRYAKSVDNN